MIGAFNTQPDYKLKFVWGTCTFIHKVKNHLHFNTFILDVFIHLFLKKHIYTLKHFFNIVLKHKLSCLFKCSYFLFTA